MIKVAHICTSRKSYKILEDKLVNLTKLGYEVSIISSKEGDHEGEFYLQNNIKQYYIDMSRRIQPIKDIKSIIKMKELLIKEEFDIVHTHTAKAGVIGRISAKLAKVKVIIHTSHGLPYFKGQNYLKYNLYKILDFIASKFCDYVGSQNYEDLKQMNRYIKEKKLFYEGNGVDLERLDLIYREIKKEDLNEIKMDLNIKNESVIFLKGARLEHVKNHKLLIQSLSELKKRGFDQFYCLFAGEGELRENLKQQVIECGLEDNIIFLGHRKDIYKFIQISDIVVLTSEKEGIPRIIMESMAFYKPVVATNVLGTRELVIDKQTGLMSEYNDVIGLADNLQMLYIDKDLRNRYGKEGRIRIEKYFTEKIVSERLDKLYKKSLKDVAYKI